MRSFEITEGPRDDIAAFSSEFDKPSINTRVQQQAARKNPAWKKSLVKLMAGHGFELVGAGVNGAVFQHPSYAYVLKVYRTDAGYEEWLHFVRTHQQNPHVPKMRGQIIRLNAVFSAVRIEPLVPCPNDAANAFLAPIENAVSGIYPDSVKFAEQHPAEGEIAKYLRDWEQASDLTPHNVMMRQNGEIVIVDPIYIEPGQVLDW